MRLAIPKAGEFLQRSGWWRSCGGSSSNGSTGESWAEGGEIRNKGGAHVIVHNAIKKVRVGEGGENKRLLGCPEIDFWALIYLQISDFSSDSSIVFYEQSKLVPPTETVSGKSQFSSRSCFFFCRFQ